MFTHPKRITRTILVCSAITITALLFSLTQWHALSATAAAPALNTFTVNGASAASPFKAGVGLGTPMALSLNTTYNLNTPRVNHTATLLQNGKVLIAGGWFNGIWLNTAELYDPASETWTPTGNLGVGRQRHKATLLQNGKVLVVGGEDSSVNLDSAELYDPATGSWTPTGNLSTARNRFTAALLQNGKVLVAGGVNSSGTLNSAELYDPATGNWAPTGNLGEVRQLHTATLLNNGKVIIAAGANNCCMLDSAELYDPATGSWTPTGNLGGARRWHTATLLSNGKVLVAGGYDGALLASAELYDPTTGSWTATGSLNLARYSASATLLPNNKVLVAGGDCNCAGTNTAELYDPANGTWTATGSMCMARVEHTGTLLPNGKVLVTGGMGSSFNPIDSIELYIYTVGSWINTCNPTPPNTSPTITPIAVTQQIGGPAAISVIANVNDTEDAEDTLAVTVNGSATVNGVTVSGIIVNNAGVVTAQVVAACGASNASFPLKVTDNLGAAATANLTVNVSANAAPVVTITGPTSGSVYPIGTAVNFAGSFTDNTTGLYTAQWKYDSIVQAGTVNANAVSATYTFTTAGVYLVSLSVTDACGATGTASTIGGLSAMVVIYDPNGGFVTGGGWINSPAGAYVDNPALTGKANFGFVSKYQNGNSLPTGNTEFQFKAGNLNFSSTVYEWMVIAGARAQYKGAGKINGAGDYRFMLTAIDGQVNGGGGTDKFRLRIWNNAGGGLVYDNQMNTPDSADPTTVLGGGSIVIHK